MEFLILLLLISSMNYFFACRLEGNAAREKNAISGNGRRKKLFILAICLNMALLLWFKYSAFILDNLSLAFNLDYIFIPPALPLGISFYTFTQIAFLSDVYSGSVRTGSLGSHVLFTCGFPWVISGPIVRKADLDTQLDNLKPISAQNCARGFTLFGIGLAKKIILADTCGLYADNVFNAAKNGWPLSTLESWAGSFLYTFQLYFDFSGYTDMALGLGLILGLTLPENFNSPYRSSGIIEFWRRWHISLGRWIRDYIYIPMGGNRNGKLRQYYRLFLTMLLAGIWHGAGWTYMLWGALHGLMLLINHAWRAWRKRRAQFFTDSALIRLVSILLTFFCVNLCWVIFRSADLDSAFAIFRSMFSLPSFNADFNNAPSFFKTLLPHHYLSGRMPWLLLLVCSFICWLMPTSVQLLQQVFNRRNPGHIFICACAWLFALLTGLALIFSGNQSTFLYFQF